MTDKDVRVAKSMSSESFSSQLQNELPTQADHECRMHMSAQMWEPTEAEKRAIAEMNNAAGWQRATKGVIASAKIKEVIASANRPRREVKSWLLGGAAVLVAAGTIFAVLILM